jgi:sugar phosphate isomerase/epimerase
MKIGVSSYSFSTHFANGTMDILGAIDWIADSTATHMELSIVGFVGFVGTTETPATPNSEASWERSAFNEQGRILGRELVEHPELVTAIKERAAERGVSLSNYVVGADLRSSDLAGQIASLKKHIDVAHELGITRFRHDVVEWAWRETDQAEFESVFASIVPICQELADYAAPLGITTSIENHGFYMNNSERVRRLIFAVDRPNFKTTLDIGNFLCIDELPESAVVQNLPHASVVHLKDFYIRDSKPGDGWLTTLAGNYILGSIVGFGDLPMKRLIGQIKNSGFDGPISIEFEGLEDDLIGIKTGLANAIRIWNET